MLVSLDDVFNGLLRADRLGILSKHLGKLLNEWDFALDLFFPKKTWNKCWDNCSR